MLRDAHRSMAGDEAVQTGVDHVVKPVGKADNPSIQHQHLAAQPGKTDDLRSAAQDNAACLSWRGGGVHPAHEFQSRVRVVRPPHQAAQFQHRIGIGQGPGLNIELLWHSYSLSLTNVRLASAQGQGMPADAPARMPGCLHYSGASTHTNRSSGSTSLARASGAERARKLTLCPPPMPLS